MPALQPMCLVKSALRCYPKAWRSRHGDEAAEIAALLIRDGISAPSIAWSYLRGAARARLASKPRRRLGAVAGALLLTAGSLGVPLALLSSLAPANAASVSHPRTVHPRPAGLWPADLWHSDSPPAGPRYGRVRGAPDRCDRHDHC